jgi:hypothetical protein
MTQIFISHAHRDKPLVDAFVDLLDTGLSVAPQDVFCTSLEGLSIPSGVNFIDHVKSKIQNPKIIILILSLNFLESQFCLCEMGAAWALSNDLIPIIIPPASHSDLSNVLTGVQARRIDYEQDLNEIRDELIAKLELRPVLARWDAKRNQFLQNIPKLLTEQANPGKIDYEKYLHLNLKYEDSLREISSSSSRIEQLENQIARYRSRHDRQEILQLATESAPEWLEFKSLSGNARESLRGIPAAVVKLLAHEMNAFRTLDELEYWEKESLEQYQSRGYLFIRTSTRYIPGSRPYTPDKYSSGGGFGSFGDYPSYKGDYSSRDEGRVEVDKTYGIIWEHPQIDRAYDALIAVKEFLENRPPEDLFLLEYEEAFGHPADFHKVEFWVREFNYK